MIVRPSFAISAAVVYSSSVGSPSGLVKCVVGVEHGVAARVDENRGVRVERKRRGAVTEHMDQAQVDVDCWFAAAAADVFAAVLFVAVLACLRAAVPRREGRRGQRQAED